MTNPNNEPPLRAHDIQMRIKDAEYYLARGHNVRAHDMLQNMFVRVLKAIATDPRVDAPRLAQAAIKAKESKVFTMWE